MEALTALYSYLHDLHLADGGYSRVGVSFVEVPFLWMDQGISLPRAVRNWNAWRAR